MEPTPTSTSTDGDGDSAYNRVSRIRRASKRSLVAPYTPEGGEGKFCELPLYAVLGSGATRGSHGWCLGALLGEPAHGRETDAASAAGDDRRSVGEVHKSS